MTERRSAINPAVQDAPARLIPVVRGHPAFGSDVLSLGQRAPGATLARVAVSMGPSHTCWQPGTSVIAAVRHDLIGHEASLQELNAIAEPGTTIWFLSEADHGASERAWGRLVAREHRDALAVTALARWRAGIRHSGRRRDNRDRR
jgi:hypothetical protein